MKKRILSIVLSLTMAVSLLPFGAMAEGTNVAEVNGTQYATLQAAIDAATDGGTVALLADINATTQISITKALTLELGAYTITGNIDDGAVLRVYSPTADTTIDVTINASTGGISNTGAGYAIYAGEDISEGNDGERTNLTINGGKYETAGTDCIKQIMGLCTINGGMYKSTFGRTVLNGAKWYGAEFAINGGSFYGFNPACVSVWTGFDGNDYTNFYHQHDIIASGKTATFADGWYTVVDGTYAPKVKTKALCYPSAGAAIQAVVGMKDVGNLGVITLLEADALTKEDVKLAMATYTESYGSGTKDYEFSFILGNCTLTLPVGYETYDTTIDGNKAVVKIKTTTPKDQAVAEIDGTPFATLLDAVNAAQPGETITLLNDYTVATAQYTVYEMPEGSTLDLNGKTLTIPFATAMFAGKNVTITNGTIQPPTDTNTDYALFIGNAVNATDTRIETSYTVKNVTISKGGINVRYGAEATIEDATVTVNPNRKYYAVYAEVESTVTIKSGNYTGGRNNIDVYAAAGATVNISDGTFNKNLKAAEGGTISISGGTFKKEFNESYAATGYERKQNADGTYTVDRCSVTGVTLDQVTASIYVGDTVTLTATVAPANAFNQNVIWSSDNEAAATVSNGVVTGVASGTATITATTEDGGLTATCTVTVSQRSSGSSSGGGSTSYAITVPTTANGTVTASPKTAAKGATVTLTVTPADGYQLDTLTVTDKNGKAVELTQGTDGKYTFTMPASKVTVTAAFQAVETTPCTHFNDVGTGDWFYDAVEYVYHNGIMNGTGETTFAPGASTTRAMVWTMLARLSGETISGDSWADQARAWAMATGVSDGTNADGDVTREQLATMLYRFAGLEGYDLSAQGDLSKFLDGAAVSDWANAAMIWANGAGIITGDDQSKINPLNDATRAEVAAMFMRFCENIVN